MSWKALELGNRVRRRRTTTPYPRCGQCEDEGRRTITVALFNGTEAAEVDRLAAHRNNDTHEGGE